jgi:hypothetical protein
VEREGGGERERARESEHGGGCGVGSSIKVCY